MACAIWDNRTTGLLSPTGRSMRKGATSLIACPGPVGTSSSGYTEVGAIARTVMLEVTGSPRDSSQLRSAPVITASTTSLTSQS